MADDAKLKVKIELDDRDYRKKVKDLKKGETVKMKTDASSTKESSSGGLLSKKNPFESIGKAFEGIKGAIGGAAGGAGGAGAGGAIAGGAAAGLAGGAVLGALQMISGGVMSLVGLIVESSAILKNTIGNILKAVMLILRPIGDFIGSLLTPLVWVLLPMAKMLNMLFKPFLLGMRRKMVEEKEAGSFDPTTPSTFDPVGAMVRSISAGLGDWFSIMGKQVFEGLTHTVIDAFAQVMHTLNGVIFGGIDGVLAGFQLLGEIILGAIPGIGEDAKEKFGNVMTTIRANITGEDGIKGAFDQAIDSWANFAKTETTAAFNSLEAAITGVDLGGVVAAEVVNVTTAFTDFSIALALIPAKILETAGNITDSLKDFKVHLPTSITGDPKEDLKTSLERSGLDTGALEDILRKLGLSSKEGDMPSSPADAFQKGWFDEMSVGTETTAEETEKQKGLWEVLQENIQKVQDTVSFGFKDKLIVGFKGLGKVLNVPKKDWMTFGTAINDQYKKTKVSLGLTNKGIATDFAEFTTAPMIKSFEETTELMKTKIWTNFRTWLQNRYATGDVHLTVYEKVVKTGGGSGGGGDSGEGTGSGSSQVGMSYVPETGTYNLHRGEKVLRANESEGQGVSVLAPITINANINNRLDLNKLAEDLSDILTTNMQSELRGRVSYT